MLNTERNCWKNFILIKNFTRPDAVLLSSIWFFFTFTIYHGHECAYSGRQYAGTDDGSRIDTAVLAAVGNDIYRNELQG